MPAKWKVKEVEELAKKLSESPMVAVAGVKALPSKQMQEIRKKLHGYVEIKVVKNRLAKLAFEKVDRKGMKELGAQITGSTALVFSKENPFKLAKMFAESRVNAPAKEGQEAPEDIVVPAGDTPFKPGPIIGDLQEVGIKAKIQGPIIAVMQDSPVIKKGEIFSKKLASVLAQLEINPMEIGIDLRAAFEDGMVYGSDVLSIDTSKVLADMVVAHQNAINLSVEAGIYNSQSVPLMISKAARGARNLAIEAEIYNAETVDVFLSKGDREAKGLAASISYEPGVKAPKEEPRAEEKPTEEKKEEAPAEEKPAEKEAPAEEKPDEKAAEEIAEEDKPERGAAEEIAEAAPEKQEEKTDVPAEDGGTQDITPETEKVLSEEADPLDQVPEVGDGKSEESTSKT